MKKFKERIIKWLGIDERIAKVAAGFMAERERLRKRDEFLRRDNSKYEIR